MISIYSKPSLNDYAQLKSLLLVFQRPSMRCELVMVGLFVLFSYAVNDVLPQGLSRNISALL